MSSPEYHSPEEYVNHLSAREREASHRLLQRITLDYNKAKALEGVNGGYLQRMVAVTPVETISFREDSKKQYLAEDSSIARRSIYVYVEPRGDDNYWVERAWVRRVKEDGAEDLFEIDKNRGRRRYEADPSTVDVVEFSEVNILEELTRKAIEQKQASIKGMTKLNEELRDSYLIVPYDS